MRQQGGQKLAAVLGTLVPASLMLAGCNAPAGEEMAAPQTATTSDVPGTSQSVTRGCYLAVDGVVHVDGPCLVFPMGADQYTLNTWDRGKPAQSHFAMVTSAADGVTSASWNADPDDNRAADLLGDVRKDGDCWVNERARICAR